MVKNRIRLTESDLHRVIKESVNKILTEMEWQTYMNASRKRKAQADDFRKVSGFDVYDTSMDKSADELERFAQERFMQKHGKNGHSHNYEGDSPSYKGRYHNPMTDFDFDVKNPNYRTWDDDDSEEPGHTAEHRKYRYGVGIPHRNYGELHDDTFDFMNGHDWTNDRHRKHTTRFDKDGEHYDPYNSSVGDEISMSTDDDYNKRQDAMANDLRDYYRK